jgi:hypothetical protein
MPTCQLSLNFSSFKIGNNIGSLLIPQRNMSAGELLLLLDIFPVNNLLVYGSEIGDGVRVDM